jgi:hypothetical protein
MNHVSFIESHECDVNLNGCQFPANSGKEVIDSYRSSQN